MSFDHGFVDLRLNQQEGQGNESFWPSFTDVMTVIVMIFLISMVVLLMRNMELVNQVRATMEAERNAAELARATGEEKEDLALKLHTTEDRLAQLQLQVMRLQEQNDLRGKVIRERNRDINSLMAERDSLTQQAAQLLLDRQRLQSNLTDSRSEVAQYKQEQQKLTRNLANLNERNRESAQKLENALLALNQQNQLLTAARQDREKVEQKYLVLADEFDNIKVRYDKLVRPARSPKGRHLVEVRYQKTKGKYRISWRDGGTGPFAAASRKNLDNKLTELRDNHPDGLYVKVILPENSGLSYTEAWKFTNHLHQSYDYYFQEPADGKEPVDNQ